MHNKYKMVNISLSLQNKQEKFPDPKSPTQIRVWFINVKNMRSKFSHLGTFKKSYTYNLKLSIFADKKTVKFVLFIFCKVVTYLHPTP
jgi:hypothetical protein